MPFHHVTAGLLYKGNYLNRSLSAGSDSEQLANISVEELDGKEPALSGRSATHGRHLRRLCVYGESARLWPPVVAKSNGGANGNRLRDKFCINDFFVRDRPRYLVSLYTDWGGTAFRSQNTFSSLRNLDHQWRRHFSILSFTQGPAVGEVLSPANGCLLTWGHGALNPAQIRILWKPRHGGNGQQLF